MPATVMHVAGARPNFPKVAPVIRALDALGVPQRLIHTGQHYDERMSDSFFRQLGLPEADVNLGVGSGSHAEQMSAIMTRFERLLRTERVALVVVYGDVNSTAAATLVAAQAQVPVAHVEAGLRSFDRSMPEEINRLVTDRLATLFFATSVDAVAHLGYEGVPSRRIHLVGNPMIDTLLENMDRFDVDAIRAELGLPESYVVATLHRPSNVDSNADTEELVKVLHAVADQQTLVLPLHPRGRTTLEAAGLPTHANIRVIEPLAYIEFLSLVRGAAVVVTDSGGVQEETTVLGVPCRTLRDTTERPVTIGQGTNQLVTRSDLPDAVRRAVIAGRPSHWPTPPLWDGQAGARIADVIRDFVQPPRRTAS